MFTLKKKYIILDLLVYRSASCLPLNGTVSLLILACVSFWKYARTTKILSEAKSPYFFTSYGFPLAFCICRLWKFFIGAKESNKRIKKENIKVLKSWLKKNKDYPYPSFSDVEELANKTSLTEKQIRVWFTNYRYVSSID